MITLLKGLALTGGEWVIYLLLACSIWSVAIILERAVLFSKEKKESEKVKELFEKGKPSLETSKWKEDLSFYSGVSATILKAGMDHAAEGAESVEERINSILPIEKKRLEKRLIVLGTLGNNAIYIGLFGTVLGVIKAFHDLAQSSGMGPEVVMQGLSEALVATAVGLLVAIPSVIAYNTFQKIIKDLLVDTESMVRTLLAQLKRA